MLNAYMFCIPLTLLILSFKVLGSTHGCHTNTKLEMPITIGTYRISDEPSKEGETKSGGYKFHVSSGPIVKQPAPSVPGVEPTDPLLPNNGNVPAASDGPSSSTAGPSTTFAPTPSAPYPESGKLLSNAPSTEIYQFLVFISDPPTYEQATMGTETDDKSFRPNYPVYRQPTSYSNASDQQ